MSGLMLKSNLLTEEKINKAPSRGKNLLQLTVSFCLGLCVTLFAVSQDHIMTLQEPISLWLNQPTDDFKWNKTQELNWSAMNQFVNVAVSPLGELYGIQQISDHTKQSLLQYAYKYDFSKNQWNVYNKDFQAQDIKFDKLGNSYLLDTSGNVYDKGSFKSKIVTGVKNFEVNLSGQIFAISSGLTTSIGALKGTFTNRYQLFSKEIYSQVMIVNNAPIYVDPFGYVTGYGRQCVTDISAGVDGSVWALSCDKQQDGNYPVIKWDTFQKLWYKVPGAQGVKLSAFNEISVAVLDSKGIIYVSSSSGNYSDVNFIAPIVVASSSFFKDSKIVVSESQRLYIESLLKALSYSQSKLCYRGSENNFAAATFHLKCDNLGPTVTIVKATTGYIFGGYTQTSWSSAGGAKASKSGFLFSSYYSTKWDLINSDYAIYDNKANGPAFGNNNQDFLISDKANVNNCITNPGYSYRSPYTVGSIQARSYLSGSNYNFKVTEYEVYQLL